MTMAREATSKRGIDAVLLDSLGTLVALEPPAPRLRAALRRIAGVEVGEEDAQRAFGAEIAYYLGHHLEGRDRSSLEDLRDRCAAAMSEALGVEGLSHAHAREAMLSSLRFTAFPDAAPALRALRGRGLRLVVASNWDCSLPDFLDAAGLAPLLDATVESATVGAAKPSPDLFRAALAEVGSPPERALHVGDSPANDVAGAVAAGIRAVLLDRDGAAPPGPEMARIRGLDELPALVDRVG
jgi:putative hydrolase of the HAD superfamily